MQNFKLFFILITLVFLPFTTEALVSSSVDRAILRFEPSSVELRTGSSFKVKALLEPSDQKINAVEATVRYPEDILKLKSWNDGNSVVNFWIQKPKEGHGTLTFQGIIPGGYASRGLLLTLEFEVIGEGKGVVSFDPSSQVLLNDGKGTRAPLRLEGLSFKSIKGGSEAEITSVVDTISPENFTPVISRDRSIFDNRYFLVFATQDKGSGIDHYEVSEDRGLFQPRPNSWIITESPIVLQDQELKSWISVRAVDKNGNQIVETLPPENRAFYQQPFFIIITCLLALFLLLL